MLKLLFKRKIRRFPKIFQEFVEKVLTFPILRNILIAEHMFGVRKVREGDS